MIIQKEVPLCYCTTQEYKCASSNNNVIMKNRFIIKKIYYSGILNNVCYNIFLLLIRSNMHLFV